MFKRKTCSKERWYQHSPRILPLLQTNAAQRHARSERPSMLGGRRASGKTVLTPAVRRSWRWLYSETPRKEGAVRHQPAGTTLALPRSTRLERNQPPPRRSNALSRAKDSPSRPSSGRTAEQPAPNQRVRTDRAASLVAREDEAGGPRLQADLHLPTRSASR